MNYWVNDVDMCMKYHECFFIYSSFFNSLLATLVLRIFSFSQLWNSSIFFQLWNKHFFVCEQFVGAGINTLIFVSDRLGPSILCRKMEKTRPMREMMDGKVVHFPPESPFRLWCFNIVSNFPFLYLDLACKQLCFPPRERYKQEKLKYKNTRVIIIL